MTIAGLALIAGYIINQLGIENIPPYIIILLIIGIFIIGVFSISKSKIGKRQKVYFYLMIVCLTSGLTTYILNRIGWLFLSKHSISTIIGGSVCCVLFLLILSIVDYKING